MKRYLKILAGLYLLGGTVHIAHLLDIPLPGHPVTFSSMPTSWKIGTVYLAVFDPLAAVGLWLGACWGEILFILIAVSQLIAYLGFPQEFGEQWGMVGFHLLTLSIYAIFKKKASTPGTPE